MPSETSQGWWRGSRHPGRSPMRRVRWRSCWRLSIWGCALRRQSPQQRSAGGPRRRTGRPAVGRRPRARPPAGAAASLGGRARRGGAHGAPRIARFINAISEFAKGFGGAVSSFSKKMDLLSSGDSLAQIGDGVGRDGWDGAHMNKLLTTSVGLVTTLISSLLEEPPDFRYAIDSFKVQGWQLAKLIVPRTEWRSQAFKSAKRAWDEVWADAADLTEQALRAWNDGNADQMIDVIVQAVEKGLRTAAHVDTSRERELTAVADLINGVSGSCMKLAHEIGWLGD
ncbi:unnamed protein product [Prorocentrum cordatum]|uniref:Uncharacterized protein n=1 Tax=Prorocentrum cordatum TaxID=2364126 RepID=A0ABN9TRA7_9DINO|nr:unnamed protein product [Polarella glacialis]